MTNSQWDDKSHIRPRGNLFTFLTKDDVNSEIYFNKNNAKCWYIHLETNDGIVEVETNAAQHVNSDFALNPTAVIVDI